ncbi:MAG: universal stress protein family protein [Porphyrobacter sp. HL-46]|nr:MAG: universal stress protein family protein [Porphyrobacter sp. HL-46]
MYRSLLIALDTQDEAGARLMAARCATRLVSPECAVHLAYVRTPLPRSYRREMPKNWEANERAEAEQWLRNFAEHAEISASVAGIHSPVGSVAQEVTRLAAALGIEAICVTAHRMDPGRFLLGTNTQAIVRDALCDVIVVRDLAQGS